jgi:hypothetical protein
MMAKSWWLTPVILATWEVETGRITVGNQTVWGGDFISTGKAGRGGSAYHASLW